MAPSLELSTSELSLVVLHLVVGALSVTYAHVVTNYYDPLSVILSVKSSSNT